MSCFTYFCIVVVALYVKLDRLIGCVYIIDKDRVILYTLSIGITFHRIR